MDIQAMVGRNGELQTAACNRLKLIARKGTRTLGQTSPEGSSVVQQSNASQNTPTCNTLKHVLTFLNMYSRV